MQTPDSVFPNNWFSTHAGGHVAIYPMFNTNRRRERRSDVIEMLKNRYRVQDVIDYSGLEPDNIFLEGTGAMVLDHLARIAYAARSNRTSEVALERFCAHFNFEPMLFDAADVNGHLIYHTNVIMCIGTEIALVGLDTIVDPARRQEVRRRLEETSRRVVALSQTQIADFAGNALELTGIQGRFLAISSRAVRSLTEAQRRRSRPSRRCCHWKSRQSSSREDQCAACWPASTLLRAAMFSPLPSILTACSGVAIHAAKTECGSIRQC